MVYVHRLMGDGAPGEADPKALSAASQSDLRAARARRRALRRAVQGPRDAAGQARRGQGGRRRPSRCSRPSGRRVPGRRRQPRRVEGRARRRRRSTPARAGSRRRRVTPSDRGRRDAGGRAPRPAGRAADALRADQGRRRCATAQRLVRPRPSRRSAQVKAAGAGAAGAVDPDQRADGAPGAAITDTVKVTGLGGADGDDPGRALRARTRRAKRSRCADAPVWTGTIRPRATASTSPRRSR